MESIEKYMFLPYSIIVIPDEDMGGTPCYRAEHPELPGCMSHGQNPEAAKQNLVEARRLYIQTLLERGIPVPEPPSETGGTGLSYESVLSIPVEIVVQQNAEVNLPTEFDAAEIQAV